MNTCGTIKIVTSFLYTPKRVQGLPCRSITSCDLEENGNSYLQTENFQKKVGCIENVKRNKHTVSLTQKFKKNKNVYLKKKKYWKQPMQLETTGY